MRLGELFQLLWIVLGGAFIVFVTIISVINLPWVLLLGFIVLAVLVVLDGSLDRSWR